MTGRRNFVNNLILQQNSPLTSEIQGAGAIITPYPFTPAEAVELGIVLIPINNDKKPAWWLLPKGADGSPTWKPFQERRPTAQELAAWERQKPAGRAAVTGAISGRISVDFDGEAGIETARKLGISEAGPIVPHRRTPSGGFHCDFIHPGWYVKTQNHVSNRMLGARWPGLDCKGDGGYVGVFGHMAHGDYVWLRDPTPYPLEYLPEELRKDLGLLHAPEVGTLPLTAEEPAASPTSPAAHTEPEHPTVQVIESSPPTAESRVDPYLLIGMARLKITEGSGRNDAGFWLCCQMRDHGFTEAETCNFASHYVSLMPATDTKGQVEAYTIRDFFASARQAYSRPAREPFVIPEVEAETDEGEGEGVDSPNRADKQVTETATDEGAHGEVAARAEEGGTPELSAVAETQGGGGEGQDGLIPRAVEAEGDLTETDNEPQPPAVVVADPVKIRKAQKVLHDLLDLDVKRVIKHGTGGGLYVMHLNDGRVVDIGTAAKMISERAFRVAILDSLNQTLPRFKPGGWKKCLDAMLDLVEVRAGLAPDQMVHQWVESFLETYAPAIYSLAEPTESVTEIFLGWANGRLYHPYPAVCETKDGGRVVLKLRELHTYVMSRFGARLSETDLASSISKIGFAAVSTLNGPMCEGKRLRVHRVWVAPTSLFVGVALREYTKLTHYDPQWGNGGQVHRVAGLIDSSREGT